MRLSLKAFSTLSSVRAWFGISTFSSIKGYSFVSYSVRTDALSLTLSECSVLNITSSSLCAAQIMNFQSAFHKSLYSSYNRRVWAVPVAQHHGLDVVFFLQGSTVLIQSINSFDIIWCTVVKTNDCPLCRTESCFAVFKRSSTCVRKLLIALPNLKWFWQCWELQKLTNLPRSNIIFDGDCYRKEITNAGICIFSTCPGIICPSFDIFPAIFERPVAIIFQIAQLITDVSCCSAFKSYHEIYSVLYKKTKHV